MELLLLLQTDLPDDGGGGQPAKLLIIHRPRPPEGEAAAAVTKAAASGPSVRAELDRWTEFRRAKRGDRKGGVCEAAACVRGDIRRKKKKEYSSTHSQMADERAVEDGRGLLTSLSLLLKRRIVRPPSLTHCIATQRRLCGTENPKLGLGVGEAKKKRKKLLRCSPGPHPPFPFFPWPPGRA